jgi:hypothetical protein
MPTQILHCTCTNTYQDKVYGIGNRVFNEMRSGSKPGKFNGYRCTVCNRVDTNFTPKTVESATKVTNKVIEVEKPKAAKKTEKHVKRK